MARLAHPKRGSLSGPPPTDPRRTRNRVEGRPRGSQPQDGSAPREASKPEHPRNRCASRRGRRWSSFNSTNEEDDGAGSEWRTSCPAYLPRFRRATDPAFLRGCFLRCRRTRRGPRFRTESPPSSVARTASAGQIRSTDLLKVTPRQCILSLPGDARGPSTDTCAAREA